jgi:hypothetical protein
MGKWQDGSPARVRFSLCGLFMNKQVRVATRDHRTAIGLLILAFVIFPPRFATGQCKEPANPKAEVPASKLDAAKLAAAAAPPGKAQKAARYECRAASCRDAMKTYFSYTA